MTASYRPRAILGPRRLQATRPGMRVTKVNGWRQGVVVHAFTDQMGVRQAFVRWDGEDRTRSYYQVSDLVEVVR